MSKNIIKVSCILLSVLLIGTMAGVFIIDQNNKKAAIAAHEAYEKKILSYQVEQNDLQKELDVLKEEPVYYGADCKIMVGFSVTDVADISYVREKAALYQFTPVLVLDCTIELPDLTALIEAADATWELMLRLPSVTTENTEKLSAAKKHLASLDRPDCGVVFYRTETITQTTISIVKENGFLGYTAYHPSPVSGQREDGSVYFDFSRLKSDDVDIDARLSPCYGKMASMIYIFEMESIHAGSLSENKVVSYLDILLEYTKKENCSFSTVSETLADLSKVNAVKAEIAASRVDRINAINARIDEIDQILEELRKDFLGNTK